MESRIQRASGRSGQEANHVQCVSASPVAAGSFAAGAAAATIVGFSITVTDASFGFFAAVSTWSQWTTCHGIPSLTLVMKSSLEMGGTGGSYTLPGLPLTAGLSFTTVLALLALN